MFEDMKRALLARMEAAECAMCDEANGKPWVLNALHHIDELESLVHDTLTSNNDLFLKVSFLQEIAAARGNLLKALK